MKYKYLYYRKWVETNDRKWLERLFTFKDEEGFKYIFHRNALYIERPYEKKTDTVIGVIRARNKTIVFEKFEKTFHNIHKKSRSWSIPLAIFNRVHGIHITMPNKDYIFATKNIDGAKSFIEQFTGIEKKIYIPLSKWEKV